jgi:hypothetical protein
MSIAHHQRFELAGFVDCPRARRCRAGGNDGAGADRERTRRGAGEKMTTGHGWQVEHDDLIRTWGIGG